MQLHHFTAASHQGVGNLLVCNGELEFIGLDCRSPVLGIETGLDSLALIGLEDISLVDNEIQFPGLDAFAEDEIEPEIDECRQSRCNDDSYKP